MASEEIILIDSASGPADAATEAVEALADAFEEADAAASAMGDGAEDAAAGLDEVASSADEAAGAEKGAAAAAKSAGAAASGGSKGWALNAAALVTLAEKAARAVIAIAKVGIAIAKAAGKAVMGREQLKSMLDQATKGHGAEALEGIDSMAAQLGLTAQEATEQFVAFREHGLKNIDSANLIKLRADLLAVGVGAEKADAAVQGTVDAIKSGKDASAAIAETAAQFGAVGNGANAAAASVYTVGGALNNAANAGQRLLDRVGDALAPAFTSAAAAATNFLDELENAPETQGYIQGLVASAIAFGQGLKEGLAPLKSVFKTLGQAMGSAKGLDALKNGFKAVGVAVGYVATAIGAVLLAIPAVIGGLAMMWEAAVQGISDAIAAIVETGQAIADWVAGIGDSIGAGIDAVTGFVGAAVQAGADLVAGLAQGIVNSASAVIEALGGIVDAAIKAVKDKLGMKSPSKVFAKIGVQTGQGFTGGIDAQRDAAAGAMQALVTPPANTNAGPRAGSGGPRTITINITVNGGGAADDIATAVRREVEASLRMVAA